MPKISPQQTLARKVEILQACRQLYQTKSFVEITLKDLGDIVPFARTSIYNYFQTKEEIFLSLLQEEFALWTSQLEEFLQEANSATKTQLAEILARTLSQRVLLLKLLSRNLHQIEANSRVENLTEFKRVFASAMKAVEQCLDKIGSLTDCQKQGFLATFWPFLYGIYPYTHITEKQRSAMQNAGIEFVERDIYQLTFTGVKQLLGD